MENNKKNIDKLFHKVLVDHEEEIPSYIWNNINNELKEKKRKKTVMIIRGIAALLAILLAFTAGYIFTSYYSAEKVAENEIQITDITDNARKLNDSKTNFNKNKKITKSKQVNEKKQDVAEKQDINNNIPLAGNDMLTGIADKYTILENDTNNTALVENILPITTIVPDSMQPISPLRDSKPILREIREKTSGNWSLGARYSPLYLNKRIFFSDSETDLAYESGTKNTASSSSASSTSSSSSIMAYSSGVNSKYKIRKRWGIQSGIFYTQKKQIDDNDYLNTTSSWNSYTYSQTVAGTAVAFDDAANEAINETISNNTDSDDYSNAPLNAIESPRSTLSVKNQAIQDYEYIDVPLLIHYTLIDRKMDVNIIYGINTGFLIVNKATVESSEIDEILWEGEVSNVSKFNCSASIGIGMEYSVYKKFSVVFEPCFHYLLTQNGSSDLISVYPCSFAVFTGFNYRF